MKSGTDSKLKFKKLQRRLKLPRWQCVGLLETLWLVTRSEAYLGDIGKLSNEDIAAALEWEAEPDALIEALVETEWLDKHPDFRLIVHHWSQHCPYYVKGAAGKHHATFADVAAKQPAKQPSLAESTAGVQSTLLPNLTKPNLTKPLSSNGLVFKKPTLEEVESYCRERENGIDPQTFVDHYEAKGWLIGKSRMKNWKAAIRTWEGKRRDESEGPRVPTAADIANHPIYGGHHG